MRLDHVDLPSKLSKFALADRSAVVFDVLRATTSMVTALGNGAVAIRTFAELDDARGAYAEFDGPKLLAGELKTVKPDDFDLGNRPPDFTRERVERRTLFFATTNGTRAIDACQSARLTFVATLANASATARRLVADDADVMLIGSGVNGVAGGEDLDGIATVADAVRRLRGDVLVSRELEALITSCSWLSNDFDRVQRLRASPGGHNIIRVGLDEDLPFVARLDCSEVVVEVTYAVGWGVARVAGEGRDGS